MGLPLRGIHHPVQSNILHLAVLPPALMVFFAWQYCEIHRETTTCYYFVDHIMEVWGQLSEVWNSEASQACKATPILLLLANC